ncbi:hypothetical protein F4818DRAFT_446479 [Hypoxylon cercidicola]|nr:hypothetical protein F4818DRAFT_446479 [Hypoxylon cercidicola]
MAAPRSTEADQGSAGVGSESRSPAHSAFANARVSYYIHDYTAPVNATLQHGVSQRDHTGLLDAVDLVFSSRHQAGTTAVATPTGSHSEGGRSGDANARSAAEVANTTRGAGARFEESRSA